MLARRFGAAIQPSPSNAPVRFTYPEESARAHAKITNWLQLTYWLRRFLTQFADWLHFTYWLVLPRLMCSLRAISQNIDDHDLCTVAQHREKPTQVFYARTRRVSAEFARRA
jgi:hypothetical protein